MLTITTGIYHINLIIPDPSNNMNKIKLEEMF